MSKTIEEILAPKPEARPRIYANSIDDKAHAGLLKVGQTTRDVKQCAKGAPYTCPRQRSGYLNHQTNPALTGRHDCHA